MARSGGLFAARLPVLFMPVLCLPLFFVAENPCGDWAVFAFMPVFVSQQRKTPLRTLAVTGLFCFYACFYVVFRCFMPAGALL